MDSQQQFSVTDCDELRCIACGVLRRERPCTTLRATVLVSEAFPQRKRSEYQPTDRERLVKTIARSIRRSLTERAPRPRPFDAGVNVKISVGPLVSVRTGLSSSTRQSRDFESAVFQRPRHLRPARILTGRMSRPPASLESGVHVRRTLRPAKAWLRTEQEG